MAWTAAVKRFEGKCQHYIASAHYAEEALAMRLAAAPASGACLGHFQLLPKVARSIPPRSCAWAGRVSTGEPTVAVLEGHSDGRAVAITIGVVVFGGLVFEPVVGDAGDRERYASMYDGWAGLDDARGGRASGTGGRARAIGPLAAD